MNQSQRPFGSIPMEGMVVLQKCVSAIPITLGKDGQSEMAPIAMLPEGAALQICGDGFDDLTVRAQCEGQAYFVFRQDVCPARKPNGSERLHLGIMRQGA